MAWPAYWQTGNEFYNTRDLLNDIGLDLNARINTSKGGAALLPVPLYVDQPAHPM